VRKVKDLFKLLKAKHYAVLIGDSEEEISWALNALQEAEEEKYDYGNDCVVVEEIINE